MNVLSPSSAKIVEVFLLITGW